MACRVLVPLDGSSLAESALAAIERLAAAGAIELVLLRVVPSARPIVAEGRVIMSGDEVTDLRRREAAAYLERVAAPRRGLGLRVESCVATGDPVQEILATVASRDMAAVVMATHGRSALPRLLFGSVTAAVVKESSVPVLTVHHPPPEPADTRRRGPDRHAAAPL